MNKAQKLEKQITVNFHVPDELKLSRYATNFSVQFTGSEYVLSFYEAMPPLLTGSQDQIQNQIEKLDSVTAECFARITLSPARFSEILTVLLQSLSVDEIMALKARSDVTNE